MNITEQLGIKFPVDSSEAFTGETIAIEFINSGSNAKKRRIAIYPGWYDKACQLEYEGVKCDGIMGDGRFIEESDADMECVGQGCKIFDILKTFIETPCRIKAMKIEASTTEQLRNELIFLNLTPTGKELRRRFTPSSRKSETNFDNKLISLNLLGDKIFTGKDRAMLYTVNPGERVTLTFYFDGGISKAVQLESIINQLG